jgi:hypothetical protein
MPDMCGRKRRRGTGPPRSSRVLFNAFFFPLGENLMRTLLLACAAAFLFVGCPKEAPKPADATKTPAAGVKAPAVDTKLPAVDTKAPAADTKAPLPTPTK